MTAYGHDEGPALKGALRRIHEEDLQLPWTPEEVQRAQWEEMKTKAKYRKKHMKGALALLGAAWGPLRVNPKLLDHVTDMAFYGGDLNGMPPADYIGYLLIKEVCGQDDVLWTIEEAHDVLKVALG